MLLCIAIGFIVASGRFSRYDLLAVAFYLGLAGFGWYPMTAAFAVMLISSVGVVFTGSGGDLLELSISLSLVAATCVPWVIVTHMVLLAVLTTYISLSSPTLAEGGIYGIVGIAVIAFLAGVAFRLVAARETFLVSERARVVGDLEAIAREDRERIADELHDGIAHDLTLVLFHSRALPKQPDDDARQVSLSTIEESAERALLSIQSLLSLMRDAPAGDLVDRASRYDGRVTKAASSLGELLNGAGVSTTVATPRSLLYVDPSAERMLTETAIEAVTNIIKHAPKSQAATIEINERSDVVELVVTNTSSNGRMKSDPPMSGRGLKRAAERLEGVNGMLKYGWTTDGWTLQATVPAEVGEAR